MIVLLVNNLRPRGRRAKAEAAASQQINVLPYTFLLSSLALLSIHTTYLKIIRRGPASRIENY